jgi:biopolymer transport protein ExbB/TolQ
MRNILKAILVISAVSAGFSAHAQGSMAPEVRVIEVKPSRSIILLGEQRRAAREARRLETRYFNQQLRDMERAEREYRRDMERRMKELDKKMHCKRFKLC